ncbi:hypothetical protein GCM10010415_17590 [Streptomyces atrovirens]
MVRTGGGPGLPLEACQGGAAPVRQGEQIRGDGHDRDETLRIHVRPLPDVSHRPSAQDPVQTVSAAQWLARSGPFHMHFPR